MGLWDWLEAFGERAYDADDDERLELFSVLDDGATLMDSEPLAALSLFERGEAIARYLAEPWMSLLFVHYQLHVLRNESNIHEALERAVRAAVEVRKPLYADFPLRPYFYEHLIACYLDTDPRGYARKIEEALNFAENLLRGDDDNQPWLDDNRAYFALQMGRFAEAQAGFAAILARQKATRSQGPSARTYSILCSVSLLQGDWETLARWASEGRDNTLADESPRYRCQLALFQALVARRNGDEAAAARFYRSAVALERRVPGPLYDGYYDAQRAFHEAGGDYEKALRATEKELAGLRGTGQKQREAHVEVQRCRLLQKLARLGPADLAAAREVAARLIDPAPMNSQLDELETL